MKAKAQNGATSFSTWLRPDLPQAHLRFSSYDGTVAMAVAAVLDTQALQPNTPLKNTRQTRLTATETADAIE
jgi:hypothetical protein